MSASFFIASLIVILASAIFFGYAFNKDLITDFSKVDKNANSKTKLVQGLNGALAVSLLGALLLFYHSGQASTKYCKRM